jgi:nickel-dependent lactate racemase
MAGLDFKVDCLINRRGEITNLYAGAFKATHAAGAEEGKTHYGISHATGYDIAVCNAYGKANESMIARHFAMKTLKPDRTGTAVLIADAPEGQISHYVFRSWGSDYGGRQYLPKVSGVGDATTTFKRLIVLAPHPDRTMLDMFCHIDDATVVKTWAEVLEILETDYPGEAKAAVVQDGTMQYMKAPGA